MKLWKILVLVPLLTLLAGCEPKGKEQESYEYQVWLFNTDTQKTLYVGKVKGLSSCRYVGNKKMHSGNLDDPWMYVCCWKTADSECKEQHQDKIVDFPNSPPSTKGAKPITN